MSEIKSPYEYDNLEQLSDLENLSIIIFKMVDEGDSYVSFNDGSKDVSLTDLCLMLCDLTRSMRLGVNPTPATIATIADIKTALAIHRASNKP